MIPACFNNCSVPIGYERNNFFQSPNQSVDPFSVPPPYWRATQSVTENAQPNTMQQMQKVETWHLGPSPAVQYNLQPLRMYHSNNYSFNLPFPAYFISNIAIPPSSNVFAGLGSKDPAKIFASVVKEDKSKCALGPKRASSENRSSNEEHIKNNFDNFIRVALDGCKLAESLASSNQKRPCFKKIDGLCARLQQDLLKTDNVICNINSQGLAWALKDFIFAFTRIMSAWIIIKGYVHEQPDELVSIQSELCPNFLKTFSCWHNATFELTQSLIASLEKLDKLTKSQRGSVNVNTQAKHSTVTLNGAKSGQPADELLETPELHNNNGNYIRVGIYKPPGFSGPPQFAGRNIAFPLRNPVTQKPYVVASPNFLENAREANNRSGNPVAMETTDDASSQQFLDCEIPEQLYGKATAGAINALLQRVFAIEEATYFFILHLTKNYFPDFHLVGSKICDLRTIVAKAEIGSYHNLAELVRDLQLIVDACKRYLNTLEMFELEKNEAKYPVMQSHSRKQEVESIRQMHKFVAKMEFILKNEPFSEAIQGQDTSCALLETSSDSDASSRFAESIDTQITGERRRFEIWNSMQLNHFIRN